MNDLHNLLRHLPPYEETPVFDLHHKRRGMETLSSQGSRSPRTCDGGVAIWPRARAVPLRPRQAEQQQQQEEEPWALARIWGGGSRHWRSSGRAFAPVTPPSPPPPPPKLAASLTRLRTGS